MRGPCPPGSLAATHRSPFLYRAALWQFTLKQGRNISIQKHIDLHMFAYCTMSIRLETINGVTIGSISHTRLSNPVQTRLEHPRFYTLPSGLGIERLCSQFSIPSARVD